MHSDIFEHFFIVIELNFASDSNACQLNVPFASQDLFVPSSDHVRVVRMLIKHLHFFSNSAKSAQPSPLDDLRKYVERSFRFVGNLANISETKINSI